MTLRFNITHAFAMDLTHTHTHTHTRTNNLIGVFGCADLCCYMDFLQLQRAGLALGAVGSWLPAAVPSLVGKHGL